MKFTKIVTLAVLMGALGAGASHAQSFRDQPAEFPPSSYRGKQYVDSKGCVFIRAGIDGNVTWVPRVSRKRQGVCGFKPSNVGTAAAAPTANTDRAVQITMDGTAGAAASTAALKPKPIPKRRAAAPVAARQAKPKVVRQTAPRPAAPAPTRVIATAPALGAQTGAGCPGRSALSQKYSRSTVKGLAVRCGPQTVPIVGTNATQRVVVAAPAPGASARVVPAPVVAAVGITTKTRIVPKHVAENRLNTLRNVAVPKGYKRVWTDGRLNPKRAEQNLGGRAQMLLIWTNTVPRRLVNQATGRDVTAQIPLVYPYTSLTQQRRELGEVTFATRDGQLVKRIVRNKTASTRKPVYSSRSAAKPAVAAPASRAVATAGAYVQVGTFSNSANAQRTAQRIAKMGMGARIGKSTRGGKTLLSVQAGPFNTSAAPTALKKLRSVGYRDAYLR